MVVVIMSKHQHKNIGTMMLATRKNAAKELFKPAWAAIVGIATLSLSTTIQPVHAFSVTYDFRVQINSDAYETQGLSKGTIEQGSFTYDNDNLTGSGSEYLSPLQGNLKLTFKFLNNIYTEKDDLNYGSSLYSPDYPALLLNNGELVGLDFLVVPSQFQPPQNAIGFRIYNDTFYFGATDNSPEESGSPVGTVTYGDIAVLPKPPLPGAGVAAVPEPSELGGAIVALSFLGIWVMKKVKGQQN